MNEAPKNAVGYIYITKNLVDGRRYIGQHHAQHFDSSYLGSGKILKQAINKYGRNNFTTEILEWCFSDNELTEKEKSWIDKANAVESREYYNILPGGPGVQLFGENNHMFGKHHTEETRKNISKSLVGKMSGENNPMYGVSRTWTEEQRKQRSELNKSIGKWVGENNPMYGKPSPMRGEKMSLEQRKKLSEAHKRSHHPWSEETRARMHDEISKRMSGPNNHWYGKSGPAHPVYGRKWSEEEKIRIGMQRKGKMMGKDNPSSKPIYSTDGKYMFWTIRELAEFLGVTYSCARHRVDRGKPFDYNGETIIFARDKEKVVSKDELHADK